MNLGVTGTLITLNSTEWTASSKECRDSHGAKGQVLGELGLDPVMKQPEKLKIKRKPRENAKKQTNPPNPTNLSFPRSIPSLSELCLMPSHFTSWG